MKICILGQSFLPKLGGEELGLDLRAREYVKQGHDVVVHVQNPAWFAAPPVLDVPYRLVWYRKMRSRHWAVPFLRRSLLRLYRDWPYDVIDCHKLYPPAVAGFQAAQACSSSLVITPHDTWSVKTLGPPRSGFNWLRARIAAWELKRACEALEKADAVTAMNRFMRDYLAGLCPNCVPHLHVIPNAVELEDLVQTVPDTCAMARRYGNVKRKYFLFLGRLVAQKGVDVLIEAFQMVVQRHPSSLLIIAGSGPEQDRLKRQAEGNGLTNCIHFVGPVRSDDRVWLLQHALSVVVPSRFEPFGKVTVEAFACGTPAVGTSVGGITELIDNGRNGILVPVDDAAKLAQGLCDMLTDTASRQRMGQEARKTAAGYKWSLVAGQFLTLFAQLPEHRATRHR
jgi:glycosyltransferase involved in cell wall biosynthesis